MLGEKWNLYLEGPGSSVLRGAYEEERFERRRDELTISITGPLEPAAEEDKGARTLFTASLCLLNCAVRFLVAMGNNSRRGKQDN